ncbi:MAG TPA: DegV family protein [Eubacteriaceae bacterium]|nr:DegV family protein [Eubacteriaceae bacterium]
MEEKKIAILTDSCSDIPRNVLERYHIYEMALSVNYKDKSYRDKIDITPLQVYENLHNEIPHTSLPAIGEIHETIKKIMEDGYNQIIIPVISSGLSGTYEAIEMVCKEFQQIKTKVIDTKNIGLGSGCLSIYAAQLREKNFDFEEIVKKVEDKIESSNIYFSLQTLKYLVKGGRLGRVEGMVGSLLQVKPIIACDKDGIYHAVDKARGRKQSINKLIKIVQDKIQDKKKYYLVISHGFAQEEANKIKERMQPYIDKAELFIEGQISPALGVLTGPGLIGIGCFILED